MSAKIFGSSRLEALLTAWGEYLDMLAALADARRTDDTDDEED